MKPKEWWLHKDGKGLDDPEYLALTPAAEIMHEFIHVVEKSAYDKAIEALKIIETQSRIRGYPTVREWHQIEHDIQMVLKTYLKETE